MIAEEVARKQYLKIDGLTIQGMLEGLHRRDELSYEEWMFLEPQWQAVVRGVGVRFVDGLRLPSSKVPEVIRVGRGMVEHQVRQRKEVWCRAEVHRLNDKILTIWWLKVPGGEVAARKYRCGERPELVVVAPWWRKEAVCQGIADYLGKPKYRVLKGKALYE